MTAQCAHIPTTLAPVRHLQYHAIISDVLYFSHNILPSLFYSGMSLPDKGTNMNKLIIDTKFKYNTSLNWYIVKSMLFTVNMYLTIAILIFLNVTWAQFNLIHPTGEPS
jgi:hypothetical protein